MDRQIEEYLIYRRSLGLSPDTLHLDQTALRRFNAYLQTHGLQYDRVTSKEIRDYRLHLTGQLQPSGAHQYLSVLKDFYRWLTTQNKLLTNPCRNLEPPRRKYPLPKNIPNLFQIKELLGIPDLKRETGMRDRAIMELAYSSGLRLSEVTGLNLDDLDFKNRQARVWGKGSKERFVPFGRAAAFYLSRYLSIRPRIGDPALFLSTLGRRLTKKALEKRFAEYVKKAGFTCKFHGLRHACALHLLQNKAGIRHIQELLGHSDLTATQIYTRLSPADLKKVHAAKHPREKEARRYG